MGYLFISVALISGAVKGYCGKRTSGFVTQYKDAMFINMVRMLFCIVIGFLMLAAGGSIALLKVDWKTLCITALSGVTTSVFVVCWLISVKRGAYMMLDVFLMLGVLVTLLCSYFAFGEPIRPNQWIGLAVLIAAVFIMCSYSNSIKGKMSVLSFVLLVICGVSNGLTDFSQKLYIHTSEVQNAAVFNFYTYIFSALTLLIFYIFFKAKDSSGVGSIGILRSIFPYVLVMSVCLFLNSFFKTRAAHYLTSAQLYPLNQGCSLILSSIMSSVLFKEKLTPKCITGLLLSFAALLIINLL